MRLSYSCIPSSLALRVVPHWWPLTKCVLSPLLSSGDHTSTQTRWSRGLAKALNKAAIKVGPIFSLWGVPTCLYSSTLSPLLRVSALSPLVAKGISCYRNGGWQLWGKSGNCKMDQLLDKAPAQEAVAAPGCQELAVLLTEPGSSFQRDFATVGQNHSFHSTSGERLPSLEPTQRLCCGQTPL